MEKEYDNRIVYDFLIEECKQKPDLWNKFRVGLLSHTTDAEFWEDLSEDWIVSAFATNVAGPCENSILPHLPHLPHATFRYFHIFATGTFTGVPEK